MERHRLNIQRVLASVLLLVLALALFACKDKPQPPQGPPPAPVSLFAAQSRDLPDYVMAVGKVNTLESVTVRSRVSGYLLEKHFTRGDFVQQGDKLFTIDPSPYLAKIKSLEAQLASDKTSYAQTRRDFERYTRLLKQAVVSEEDYEQKRLDMRTAQDKIAMTQADLANARNDLKYCYIDSPLSGLAGYIWPSVGDLISANDDKLVVINQIQPMAVDFHVPQRYMPEIRKHMQEAGEALTVLAIIPGQNEPEAGKLTFYDNEVNKKTGTIWLEATFDNQRMRLWPGAYVQVRLKLYEQKGAVVVPYEATCFGPEGKHLWVAHRNKTVEMRPVEVARRSGKYDVIASGLEAGEVVVTDGQIRLYPGASYVQARSPDAREEQEPFETSTPPAAKNATDQTPANASTED